MIILQNEPFIFFFNWGLVSSTKGGGGPSKKRHQFSYSLSLYLRIYLGIGVM